MKSEIDYNPFDDFRKSDTEKEELKLRGILPSKPNKKLKELIKKIIS